MQKKDKYVYPAIFTFYDDEAGKSIDITFPDLPGCVSCGFDLEDALNMASDALGVHMSGLEEDGDEMPDPSDILTLKNVIEDNQNVMPITVLMPEYRSAINNKAVNKTVTLPQWLVTAGKEANINFSQTLQDALMQKLGITRKIKRRKSKANS